MKNKSWVIAIGILILIILIAIALKSKKAPQTQIPSSQMTQTSPQYQTPQQESQTPLPPEESDQMVTETQTSPKPKVFNFTIENSKLNPISNVEVSPGESIEFKITNKDDVIYSFTWREEVLKSVPTAVGSVGKKGEVTFSFIAPQDKGKYCFYLEYPFNLSNPTDCSGNAITVEVK